MTPDIATIQSTSQPETFTSKQPVIAIRETSLSDQDANGEYESESSDIEQNQPTTTNDMSQSGRQANEAAFAKHIRQPKKHPESYTSKPEKDDPDQILESVPGRIIDKVRAYQQELFERAKQENVIAVLDTGCGKTLIACLLIRHVLDQETLDRATTKRQRIVFFCANSVHLVEQQARVLASNLTDQPIVLHGSSKQDLWKQVTWDKIKEHNRVVVCTPVILDQTLMHSFIKMHDISLLVFDEAHHAKKDHPYSRLIRSHYLRCPPEDRPRIFGMTASAVDSKGDIVKEAKNLEELLHAKIITTDDGSLLSFAPKPTDVKWFYSRPSPQFETDLRRRLAAKASFCKELKQGFIFSKKATIELGPWCADRVWKWIVGDSANQSSSIRMKFEKSDAYANLVTVEEREQALLALDDAVSLVQGQMMQNPGLVPASLSPKVNMLFEKLAQHYQENPNTRAIIFVEERLKALVLHDCFRSLSIPNVRSGVLLGIAGSSFEAVSMKNQEEMLQRFRAGIVNLVFATSVADEGLDIPQCNLCVRFDLCKTTIQYMQSKGRARMVGSIFAHMMEEGNSTHSGDVDYQIQDEQFIKRWCASLEPDRRLADPGQGLQLKKLLEKDTTGRSFKTSADSVCDSSNALTVLARFAASLQHTGALDKEIYEVEIDEEKALFRYAVRLPDSNECSFRGCRGDWKTSKQLAKRSAAWYCCYRLRREKFLDEKLNSVYRKLKPENASARLAVTAKKSAYEMQIKPNAWKTHLGETPAQIYATVISFEPERTLKHGVVPMVVLTRTPLPDMPDYPVYLEGDVKTMVVSKLVPTALPVSHDELKSLTVFTLEGVFYDVFNKQYAHEMENMTYWLAPSVESSPEVVSSIEDIIDVPALVAAQSPRQKWQKGDNPQEWANKFISDPLNGKFHYFTGEIVPGASIHDPISEDIPRISQKKRRNIIDFSDSLWTASKKKRPADEHYDPDQPVISASLVSAKRDFLDQAKTTDFISCQIAPEPLQIARISPGFAASCLVWPSLIHRTESYMIVLEAFEKLGLPAVSADLALEAFTKDVDNEDEQYQTHTGGKRGMGKNYERLEFIGDSLLKMTTTMTVFNRTTCDEEGMHCRRMEILCNRNLFNVSTSDDLQLYKYARVLDFDRAMWYPEGLKLLKGRGAKKIPEAGFHEPVKHDLGMKTIADISEAIIGAAITSTGYLPLDNNRFDLGIRAITKLVRSDDHAVDSWAEIASQYKSPSWSLQMNDPIANDRARLVGAKTGYAFRRPRLLRSAFTHSSDINSPVPDLQRLEFLGDAVLDWVCISWLFNTNPDRNPQWLTEHKMAMVSNKFLAALAVTLDFDKFVFLSTAKLIGGIQTYATKVREALANPECPNNFWTFIESPPKALSDLVESYLGAVLVDSEFNYAEIETFFEKDIKRFFVNISDYDTYANRHPTTYLKTRFDHVFKCRNHDVLHSGDPNSDSHDELNVIAGVVVHGQTIAEDRGVGVRYALARASKKALTLMEGMSREEFRSKFGCNCTVRA